MTCRPRNSAISFGLAGTVNILSAQQLNKNVILPTDDLEPVIGITKVHFVDKSKRKVCLNRNCRAKFNLVNLPHNCYKCGEVFCNKCLMQKRRLNIQANYDPQGRFYRVCQRCFNSEQPSCGAKRRLFDVFKSHRQSHINSSDLPKSEWANSEWRILEGFLQEVNSTPEFLRTLQTMTISFTNSTWKKPNISVDNCKFCILCTNQFNKLLRSRHQCGICGNAICSSCSNTDLIVYVPDDTKREDNSNYSTALLRLIKTPEGPSTEPVIHQYLRICNNCHKCKKDLQTRDTIDAANFQKSAHFWGAVCSCYEQMVADQKLIESAMEKYEKLARSLEDGSDNTSQGSNVRTLTKAQIDLSDALSTFAKHSASLKNVKPISTNTATLVDNMIRMVSRFYLESKCLFAELRSALEDYLPMNVVEAVQNQVHKNALLGIHFVVRQLALEVLSYSNSTPDNKAEQIVEYLAETDEIINGELRKVLEKEGDYDWDEHMKLSKEMVKELIITKPKITPTPWVKSRPNYLLNEIVERSCLILDLVHIELTAKVTHSSYAEIKSAVLKTKDGILAAACETLDQTGVATAK